MERLFSLSVRLLAPPVVAGVFAVATLTVQAAPKKKDAASSKPASSTARTAADFTWTSASGKGLPGKNFRGQPVVILIGASPDEGELRKQAQRIEDRYLDFAARKAIFVAAFTGAQGRVASNVPFAIAQNGAAVAQTYGVQGKVGVVVLGPDGNVDFVSSQVEGAQRLLDVIANTYQNQAAQRSGTRS